LAKFASPCGHLNTLNMPTSVDYIEIRSLHDLYRSMEGKKKAIFRYIVVEGTSREDFVGEICMIEYEDGSYKSFNIGIKTQDGIKICYWHTDMLHGEPRRYREAKQVIPRSTDTEEETNPFDEELKEEEWDGSTISPIEEKVPGITWSVEEELRVTHDGFGNPY